MLSLKHGFWVGVKVRRQQMHKLHKVLTEIEEPGCVNVCVGLCYLRCLQWAASLIMEMPRNC